MPTKIIVNKRPGNCTKCGAPVPARAGTARITQTGYGRGGTWTVWCADCGQAEDRRLACVEEDRLAYYGSAERADTYSPSGW